MEKSKAAWVRLGAHLFLGLAVGLFLQACASKAYDTVPSASVGKVQRVDVGTVVATRTVTIDGEATYIGHSSGAVVGSAVGQTVGKGSGRTIAAAGGAVVGGIVGGMIEKEMSKKTAQELTIDLDDGGTVVVVQEQRDIGFAEGDRVTVSHTPAGDAHVSYAHYNYEEELY